MGSGVCDGGRTWPEDFDLEVDLVLHEDGAAEDGAAPADDGVVVAQCDLRPCVARESARERKERALREGQRATHGATQSRLKAEQRADRHLRERATGRERVKTRAGGEATA